MKNRIGRQTKRIISYLVIASVVISAFSGCSMQKNDEYHITGFAFDTTYTITLYEGGSQKLVNDCVKKCREYEKIFSRTLEESQLYQINEIEKLYNQFVKRNLRWKTMQEMQKISYEDKDISVLMQKISQSKSKKNQAVFEIRKDGSIVFQISEILSEMIEAGLDYSEKSGGAFDIAIEPITSLWSFKEEDKKIPSAKMVDDALQYVDYQEISVNQRELTFKKPGMGIDLGGIAKGYIADQLKEYLKEQGVNRALINLGGNILCLGRKSDKESFGIGIQQPFADRNETVAAVSIDDMSVVSSGIYERYITDGAGKQYHHIINPKTGYSYENDLMAVTIISKKSIDGDGLSTTCFSLGKEKGVEYIDSLKEVYAMFITKDEKVWYSKGFQDFLMEQ